MAIDDLISEYKTKISALIEPINGGVGADISYDEAFDKLKNEVDKMQSLAGGKIDWAGICSGADELLTDKSKDFRVALYFAAAKAQLDGLNGLLEGLVLLNELTNAFWDTMYPSLKRPKARGNLAGWYSDIAAAPFAEVKTTSNDADLVGAIDKVSRELDGTLRDKLGESYPGMGNLRNLIRGLVANTPKKEAPPPPPPPPPPKPAAPPPPPPPPPQTSAAPPPPQRAAPPPPPPPVVYESPPQGGGVSVPSAGSITDADSAMAMLPEVALLLVRIGDALRAGDASNPLAYRCGRMGAWLELVQAPPADGNTTLVPSPPSGLREQWDEMAAAGNWQGVLAAADETSTQFILWLDPLRYVAKALSELGDSYADARNAYLREVAFMLQRAPSLPELSFNDGSAFADDETKAWIAQEVQPMLGSGGGGGGGGGASGGGKNYLDKPLKQARELMASEQLPEALTVLAKAAAAAPTPSDKFKVKLASAQICLQVQQFMIAKAQLEGLDKLIEQHGLLQWEPELCAEHYAALYSAYRSLGQFEEPTPETRQRMAAVFERLCQLDAGAAVKALAGV